MKQKLYLFSLVFLSIVFVQCGNNDDDNVEDPCSQSAWIGVYSGICEEQPYTLTVTPVGSQQLELEVTLPNGTGSSTSNFDDCNYSFTLFALTVVATLDANTILYKNSSLSCNSILFTKD